MGVKVTLLRTLRDYYRDKYPSGDKGRLKRILERLNSIFPDATISGMQSFGSFINHQISDLNEAPIFSIIELEKSRVSSLILGLGQNYTGVLRNGV